MKVSDVLIVVNGKLESDEPLRNIEGILEILYRENCGFDAGGIKYVVNLRRSLLSKYDEVVLCNNTNIGPFTSFESIFSEMGKRKVDFWGINYVNIGILPHIQSDFRCFSKATFNVLWKYFDEHISFDDKYFDVVSIVQDYENQTYLTEKRGLTQDEFYRYAFALDEQISKTFFMSICVKCVEKELYKKIQNSIDERVSHQEDVSFTIRLGSLKPRVFFINNAGYHYNRRDNSMVSQNVGVKRNSDEIVLYDTLKFLETSDATQLKRNCLFNYARSVVLHDFKKMQVDDSVLFPFENIKKGNA